MVTMVGNPSFIQYDTVYSGKFSLMQNFTDLPITHPEEIFHGFNYCVFSQLRPHHPREHSNFTVLDLAISAQPVKVTVKFAPCKNFPLYSNCYSCCDSTSSNWALI